jgi:hypothetical protein
MANKIAQIIATYTDAAGKNAIMKFNVPAAITGDNLAYDALVADVKQVLDEVETLTGMKYVKAQAVLPLTVTITGAKTDPVAGSTIFRQGLVTFKSAVGDAGRPGRASIWIPSPALANLNSNQTAFATADADFTAFTGAVITDAMTEDGRALVSFGETAVRQRVTRK